MNDALHSFIFDGGEVVDPSDIPRRQDDDEEEEGEYDQDGYGYEDEEDEYEEEGEACDDGGRAEDASHRRVQQPTINKPGPYYGNKYKAVEDAADEIIFGLDRSRQQPQYPQMQMQGQEQGQGQGQRQRSTEQSGDTGGEGLAMPSDFYNGLDSFLSRAPRIGLPDGAGGTGGDIGTGGGYVIGGGVKAKTRTKGGPGAGLGVGVGVGGKKSAAAGGAGTGAGSRKPRAARVAGGMPLPKKATSTGPIDHSLLQEAFSYVDQLSSGFGENGEPPEAPLVAPPKKRPDGLGDRPHNAFEAQQQSQIVGQGREGQGFAQTYQHTAQNEALLKKADFASGQVNVIRRLRAQEQQYGGGGGGGGGLKAGKKQGKGQGQGQKQKARSTSSEAMSRMEGGFSVSAKDTDESLNSHCRPVDYDALCRNFSEGLTATKLREELKQSQDSMDASRDYIKRMSREMGLR